MPHHGINKTKLKAAQPPLQNSVHKHNNRRSAERRRVFHRARRTLSRSFDFASYKANILYHVVRVKTRFGATEIIFCLIGLLYL